MPPHSVAQSDQQKWLYDHGHVTVWTQGAAGVLRGIGATPQKLEGMLGDTHPNVSQCYAIFHLAQGYPGSKTMSPTMRVPRESPGKDSRRCGSHVVPTNRCFKLKSGARGGTGHPRAQEGA